MRRSRVVVAVPAVPFPSAPRPRRRRAAALVAALGVLLPAGPALAGAGGALPAKARASAPRTRSAAVSVDGWAVTLDRGDTTEESVAVVGLWAGPRHELPGRHVRGLAGRRADLVAAAYAPPLDRIESVDLATGAVTPVDLPGWYVASVDEGVVVDADPTGPGALVLVRPDGSTRELSATAGTYCAAPCRPANDWRADDAGMIVLGSVGADQVVEYVDFATGAVSRLAQSPDAFLGVALSAGRLAWMSDAGVLYERARAGGPVTERRTGAAYAYALAITDTASAWVQETVPVTAPAGPSGPATATTEPLRGPLVTDGTDFYATLGDRPLDAGLYRIAPGSRTGTLAVPSGSRPAETYRVWSDVGRLVYSDDSDRHVTAWQRAVDGAAVGPEAPALPGGAAALDVSAGAVLSTHGRLFLGEHQFATVPIGGTVLSGYRVLAPGHVHYVNRGGFTTHPAPRALDLWGPYLLRATSDNTLLREDLDAPGTPEQVVVGPGGPIVFGHVWGDWVLWQGARSGARNMATGATVDLPDGVTVAALGDGVAVGLRDDAYVAIDLTTPGAPVTVLSAYPEWERPDFGGVSVWGRRAVWVDPAGRAHWAELDAAGPPAPTRLLDAAAPPAFSPDGDGRADFWPFHAAFSAPVRHWSLVVRDAAGAVVAERSGSAPLGRATAVWYGDLSGRGAAPDGTYSWELVAGDVVRTETVDVRRNPPLARLTAPRYTVPARPDGAVTLGLVSHDANVRSYEVFGATRVRRPDGTWADGPETLVATAPAGTGSVTVPMPPGATRRFRVRAVAAWGPGPLSAPAQVTAPFDDRYPGVALSSGWTRLARPGAYAGTETATHVRGATARMTGEARRLALVGARCPDCGPVEVYVDGRLVAVVATRAASYQARQVLWEGPVLATARRQTVTVRTTGGRVVLDGFLFVR